MTHIHDVSKTLVLSAVLLGFCLPVLGQQPADPVRVLVQRLDLERYKATIKGLTRFGDRRQGTQRNRDAIDWIEAQLKSYGCANTERLTYQFGEEPPHRVLSASALHQAAGAAPEFGVGGARQRGVGQVGGVGIAHGLVLDGAQPEALRGVVGGLLEPPVVETQHLGLAVFEEKLAVIGAFEAADEMAAGIVTVEAGTIEQREGR